MPRIRGKLEAACEAASESELRYASKCARKKATRQSALASSYDEPFCRLAGPSTLCTHLGSTIVQRHPVGTFELRENLCHWSYLNPSVHVTMLQRNLAHVRHCGNLFANFPLDQDMLEGQADP